jgi:predicted nucleic acid-binding protein
MTGYVVDASVAVKWLAMEEHSDKAALLLKPGITLAAPELVFAEAANALWSMRRRGDITDDDLDDAVDLLRAAPITTHPLRELAAAASRLAVELDHPVYDCFYLALAQHEGCLVVTADARFLTAVGTQPHFARSVTHVRDL